MGPVGTHKDSCAADEPATKWCGEARDAGEDVRKRDKLLFFPLSLIWRREGGDLQVCAVHAVPRTHSEVSAEKMA